MEFTINSISDPQNTSVFEVEATYSKGDYKITQTRTFDGNITKDEVIDFLKEEGKKLDQNINTRIEVKKIVGETYEV